jgi:cell shape-determining protein MreC
VYPPGISLGRVSKVLYQNNDGSIELELASIADYARLEYVFVIDAQRDAGQDAPADGTGNG